VVIDQIDICRIRSVEFENDPPIARDRHRPLSAPLAPKRVQLKAGEGQAGRAACVVQRRQYLAQLAYLLRIDPGGIAALEQPLQPAMPKSPDHFVTYNVIGCETPV
jgi:hypothetical protein